MQDIIQIKCSFCGAVLSVRNQPGIEGKNVTCPVCRNKSPFTSFRRIDTPIADNNVNPAAPKEYESTEFPQINMTIGCLLEADGKEPLQLKTGKNVIGRKSKNSQADFQIETGENRAMSRQHIVIDVNKVEGRGIIHCVSLFKENVNATFIGDEQLLYGDSIILNDGDIIRLPGTTLKFEIPDEEATQI